MKILNILTLIFLSYYSLNSQKLDFTHGIGGSAEIATWSSIWGASPYIHYHILFSEMKKPFTLDLSAGTGTHIYSSAGFHLLYRFRILSSLRFNITPSFYAYAGIGEEFIFQPRFYYYPLFPLGIGFGKKLCFNLKYNFIPKLDGYHGFEFGIVYYYEKEKRKPVVKKPVFAEETYKKPAQKLKLPPYLEIREIYFIDEGKDTILDAEEKGWVYVEIYNKGKGIAKDLTLYVSSLENYKGIEFKEKINIEEIGVKKGIKVKIPVEAKEDVEDRIVKLRIDVKEPYFGADADPKIISFTSKALEPPEILIAQTGIDDDEKGLSMGNYNSKIDPGETIELNVIFQNQGTGKAQDVRVKILPPDDKNIFYIAIDSLFGKDSLFYIGKLEPGEWKKMVLPLYVSKRIKKEKFRIPFIIFEKRKRFTFYDTLTLALGKKFRRPEEIVMTKEIKEKHVEIKKVPELLVDVDVNIPEGRKINENAVAVIIGISEYENTGSVDYALRDASIIKEYLLKTFGFKEENIIFYKNPGKSELERVFGIKGNYKGQLYNYIREGESEVFIYYSGHGAPGLKDKRAYLLPSDAHPDYVEIEGYPLDLLIENLSKLNVKRVILVIDACFSGAYQKGMLIAKASPLAIDVIKPAKRLKNGIIITASGEREVASWYPEKKHGLFTYYFLKGISGSADKDGDKVITLGELKEYLKKEVSYMARRLYGREQHPRIEGKDEEIIVELK